MDFAAVFGAALDERDARMAAEDEVDEAAAEDGEGATQVALHEAPAGNGETEMVDDNEEFTRWWESRDVGADTADSASNGTITLARVIDGVVGTKTLGGYVGDVVQFLGWCHDNEEDWVTPYEAQPNTTSSAR